MHWAERYVGRAYVEGAFDCGDLVVLASREVFGREIQLPARAAGRRGRDRQIAGLIGDYAIPAVAPVEGDGVLMRRLGRRRVLGHHIGLWCAPGGVPHVLHCFNGIGTCLHPLHRLGAHGFEATGVYRWI